ncbi:hypothetical protein DIPPA_12938 [Diplonema papillatum]|nr:hypothetical protein DIPPA_12938 [Diplonema papillatum]
MQTTQCLALLGAVLVCAQVTAAADADLQSCVCYEGRTAVVCYEREAACQDYGTGLIARTAVFAVLWLLIVVAAICACCNCCRVDGESRCPRIARVARLLSLVLLVLSVIVFIVLLAKYNRQVSDDVEGLTDRVTDFSAENQRAMNAVNANFQQLSQDTSVDARNEMAKITRDVYAWVTDVDDAMADVRKYDQEESYSRMKITIIVVIVCFLPVIFVGCLLAMPKRSCFGGLFVGFFILTGLVLAVTGGFYQITSKSVSDLCDSYDVLFHQPYLAVRETLQCDTSGGNSYLGEARTELENGRVMFQERMCEGYEANGAASLCSSFDCSLCAQPAQTSFADFIELPDAVATTPGVCGTLASCTVRQCVTECVTSDHRQAASLIISNMDQFSPLIVALYREMPFLTCVPLTKLYADIEGSVCDLKESSVGLFACILVLMILLIILAFVLLFVAKPAVPKGTEPKNPEMELSSVGV